MAEKLRVAVLGAGRWAQMAHVPGWLRDPRCEVVVICDPIFLRVGLDLDGSS
jgi:predicted dehydrogenase